MSSGSRSIASGTIGRRFIAVVLVSSLTIDLARVEGRKCICTSKACKKDGVDTCKTEFSCYTELILTIDQKFGENITTKGCTERALPLLCETKSSSTTTTTTWKSSPIDELLDKSSKNRWIRMPWLKLKCCDSHDYCNADRKDEHESAWIRASKVEKGSRAKAESSRDTKNPEAIDSSEPSSDDETTTTTTTTTTMSSSSSFTTAIVGLNSMIDDERESLDRHLRNRERPLHFAAIALAVAALISVLAACYVITRFLKGVPYTSGNVE